MLSLEMMAINSDIQTVPQMPKPEKVDIEIEEIAKKIREANEKKMVQLRSTPFAFIPPAPIRKPMPENNTDDWTSVHGQFGWCEVGNVQIPYLTRSGETYVALRMADAKIFAKCRAVFSDEIHDCYKVEKLPATRAEAQLLNEINFRHCDKSFGRGEFTTNDTIISLKDVNAMHEFYTYCYARIVQKNLDTNKCSGFIRISSTSCVPYVKFENRQYVPLFYFEGECRLLEERSINLRGWELAYLKLACKVQGIRKPFFDNDFITVVELELLKKFFPPDTLFEEFWLTDCNVDSLLQKPPAEKSVSQEKPKQRILCYSKEVPAALVKNSKSLPGGNPLLQQQQTVINQLAAKPLTANSQNGAVYSIASNMLVPNSAQFLPAQNTFYQQQFMNTISATTFHPPTVTTPRHIPPTHTACQNINTSNVCRDSYPLANYQPVSRVKEATVPNNNEVSKIYQIAEVTYNGDRSPYVLNRMQVDGIYLNSCINKDPFNCATLLTSFEEISDYFRVPVEKVVNAISVMKLDVFLPNKAQGRLLAKANIYPTRGLIKIKSFIENLPQIRYILTQT